MIRLKVQYTRTYRAAEIGTVYVDVPDDYTPFDILQKLDDHEFSRYLCLGRETDDDVWNFNPNLEEQDALA